MYVCALQRTFRSWLLGDLPQTKRGVTRLCKSKAKIEKRQLRAVESLIIYIIYLFETKQLFVQLLFGHRRTC